VDVNLFPLLLLFQDSAAIRTYKGANFEIGLVLLKPQVTDFTQYLSTTTCIVVIEIGVRGPTTVTDNIRGNRVFASRLNWFKLSTMFKRMFPPEILVIKLLWLLDVRKLVHSKLWYVGLVMSHLSLSAGMFRE